MKARAARATHRYTRAARCGRAPAPQAAQRPDVEAVADSWYGASG